eukprot:Lithocolla_globosa_v1_NODE_6871_length_1024_cov_12.479876.p1 type:complete len:300 gc:universal NODE_6871_length_1024_cov_12.479876:66-965(+)
MDECYCDPLEVDGNTYSQFIGNVFGVCAYSGVERCSFFFLTFGIFLSYFRPLPQIYLNYSLRHVEAISTAYVSLWVGGTCFMFLACAISNQPPLLTYSFLLLTLMLLVLLGQCLWLVSNTPKLAGPRREAGATSVRDSSRGFVVSFPLALVAMTAVSHLVQSGDSLGSGRALLSEEDHLCDYRPKPLIGSLVISSAMAYLAGFAILASRFPQIYRNHQRQATAGLSNLTIAFCFASEFSLVLSYLLRWPRTDNGDYYEIYFPLILATMGAFFGDCIICYQSFKFRKAEAAEKEDYARIQ